MALLRVLLPVAVMVSAANLLAIDSAKAALASGLGVESSVQLESSAGLSAELESMDLSVAKLQGGELRSVQSAPGFSSRSFEIESLLKAPNSAPQTSSFPVLPNSFVFNNGSVGLASGTVNQQYFKSCFHADYGILGGSSDQVLAAPLTARADSGVSPFLDQAALARLQSLKVNFRYGFNKGIGSSTLKLYLTNLTTGRVQYVGNLKATSGLKNPCANVSKDLTRFINEPGVYGIRFVMSNRAQKKSKVVAGFNGVTVNVTRSGTGALLIK